MIFSFLDRYYLLQNRSLPQINDMLILKFRHMVFGTNRSSSPASGTTVIKGMRQLVDQDRRGDGNFDSILLKEAVMMLHVLQSYNRHFERAFLSGSANYFDEFADNHLPRTLKDYVGACTQLLRREDFRCNAYNFDSTTKKQLLDDAHHTLIESQTEKLLDEGSISKLLADNDTESMKLLYELLRFSSIQKSLRSPWETYIRRTGSEIVNDVDRGDEMINRLLKLRRQLDLIIRDAFDQDENFTWGLREAFGQFINDKKTTSSWKTGTSKVGEMIAKYIDLLLRGGLKTLPPELLSDQRDRAAAERSGLASTGDEDAELDRQLDNGLELFRFIEGKDVFEAFYKKDLARRLLMGRSASNDAEKSMLSKLKSECGHNFTKDLEIMFKDTELIREDMAAYKQSKDHTDVNHKVDLQVNVLTSAAWPSYRDVAVQLPPEVLGPIEHFQMYYKKVHTGRVLTWKHNLSHCVVKAKFDKGTKELLVSAFQAAVLVLFNNVEAKEPLSYSQILQATGLEGAELERTLQSLACGKSRVLQKSPKGKDVNTTDTFVFNKTFTDPKYRVKINQIQLRETKEENKETHERVAADRQFETQAAIVRIMKSRKTLPHAQLVAEVINQTKSRGAMDPADIKANIEK
jgi:cullin 4